MKVLTFADIANVSTGTKVLFETPKHPEGEFVEVKLDEDPFWCYIVAMDGRASRKYTGARLEQREDGVYKIKK